MKRLIFVLMILGTISLAAFTTQESPVKDEFTIGIDAAITFESPDGSVDVVAITQRFKDAMSRTSAMPEDDCKMIVTVPTNPPKYLCCNGGHCVPYEPF